MLPVTNLLLFFRFIAPIRPFFSLDLELIDLLRTGKFCPKARNYERYIYQYVIIYSNHILGVCENNKNLYPLKSNGKLE